MVILVTILGNLVPMNTTDSDEEESNKDRRSDGADTDSEAADDIGPGTVQFKCISVARDYLTPGNTPNRPSLQGINTDRGAPRTRLPPLRAELGRCVNVYNNNTFTWSGTSGVLGCTGQRRVAPAE
jgi:hypothetical protein